MLLAQLNHVTVILIIAKESYISFQFSKYTYPFPLQVMVSLLILWVNANDGRDVS